MVAMNTGRDSQLHPTVTRALHAALRHLLEQKIIFSCEKFNITNGQVREIKCRYNLISHTFLSAIKTRYTVWDMYYCIPHGLAIVW